MRRWLLPLLLLALALPARAELWGFVDAAGVAHFASSQIDPRYAPVLGRQGTQRVPGKTDAGTAMLTWLDIAPEVKAVQPWVREAAEQTGVDAELLKAVIAVESSYQKGAVRRAGGRVPDIEETQAHVHLVLELYWALLQQSQPAHAQRLTLHP